jgi:hypothetical protein
MLCAHEERDPGTVANLDEYMVQKLKQHPLLRQGWEIGLSVAAEPQGPGLFNHLVSWVRTIWQRRRRDRMVDEAAEHIPSTTDPGYCLAIIPVGGETEVVPTAGGKVKEIRHAVQDAFFVRILGLPAESVRRFAVELGKKFGRSRVQLKAFGQDKAESVEVAR